MTAPARRISVVIPSYDAEPFLAEALASALAQTRAPHEILVVDDASTDGTAALAERWASRDARIRVLRQDANRGHGVARNRGMREATGELIAVLDADDVWEPWHLDEVASLLERHPEAAVAGAAARYGGTRSGVWIPRFAAGGPERIFWEALRQPPFQHSTTIFRRDVLLAAGGYREDQRRTLDVELFMRLAYEHPFVCSHRVTCTYRAHAGQISASAPRQIASVFGQRRALLEQLRTRATASFTARYECELRALWRRELAYAMRHHQPAVRRALVDQWRQIPGVHATDALWWRAAHAGYAGGRLAVRTIVRFVPPRVRATLKRRASELRGHP